MRSLAIALVALVAGAFAQGTSAAEDRWSGFLSLDARVFPTGPLFSQQSVGDASLAVEPEYYRSWDGGRQDFVVTAFARLDAQDSNRTHLDLRELSWRFAAERWELRAGFRKVFWGVVESYHLVDFINQTDLVEDIDGEQKLGQPMLNFAWIQPFGTVDVFLLTGFRQRTFPGARGRLRFPIPIDGERATFESSAGRARLDWAARWSKSLGAWDLGVAHFAGTSREPVFRPELDEAGAPLLAPYYELAHRTSLDLQLTRGGALYKLEAVRHDGGLDDYLAAVGGIEYTFFGVFGSRADLGLLGEYLYSEETVNVVHPFTDDIFVGARLALNDVDGTQALAGVTVDRETGASFFNLEASRRLDERWRLEVRARAFAGLPDSDIFYGFRLDDYLHIALAWYF